jgi:LysM repeat protein
MSFRRRSLAHAGALTMALGIAACSHGPKAGPQAGSASQAAPAGEVDAILLQLEQGDEAAANKNIKAALKRDPMNPSLQLLRDSIERDPKDLLGPTSFAYTTRTGDTMSGLAQRFLGNRLKAYQLARYNGIAKPAALAAGQSLRIPGQLPRLQPLKRPEPRPAPPVPTPAKPRAVTPKPVAPVAPAANPIAARQARAAGLAALNSGNVARAVGQLRRAAALDPGNPVIARDLTRAERIAATVKARK